MSASHRKINVLGIESSCDDTGVAIVNQDGHILSNCINSQLKQHLSNGGIIPMLAKEKHLLNIDHVARQAFKESGLKSVAKDIDAIAVSNRPGLGSSLQVGLNYARALAKKYSKPLIPIHHMQAHALMPLLNNKSIRFPFITLLLSGGHCILSIAKRYNDYHVLGNKLDEAPGDLLDKFARRFKLKNLGPPYDSISGGAAVELLGEREGADKFKYFIGEGSVPMLKYKNCNFSFSGYRGNYEDLTPMIDEMWLSGNRDILMTELSHICASLQRVILVQLVKKLQRAFLYYRMYWRYQNEDTFANDCVTDHLNFKLQSLDNETTPMDLVVSGGVAANNYFIRGLRLASKECFESGLEVHVPPRSYCSDNGLMVAWNGMLRYQDFLERGVYSNNCSDGLSVDDINNSVVIHEQQMDLVQVSTQCQMGFDISDKVERANFQITRLAHPEFSAVRS